VRTISNDIKYGLRKLAKSPGFTTVAILALTIGIGANTSIFSLVNSLLLSPFPVPEPERVIRVFETHQERGIGDAMISGPNFLDVTDQVSSFETASLISTRWFNLTHADEPIRVSAYLASPNIFETFGIQSKRGRPFLPEEDQPGKHHVAVMSHGLWADRFGEDPALLGDTIELDGEAYTVIGVLPENLTVFEGEAKLWLPLPIEQVHRDRDKRIYSGIARMKDGVTLRQAQAELDTISASLAREFPEANAKWSIKAEPALQKIIRVLGHTFLVLHCAVALVLLIACANVASLLLARGATRQKELSVRAALGAGRWRVVRQLLVESVILGVLGGVAGLLLTYWAMEGLKGLVPPVLLPYLEQRGIDQNLLLFTLVVSIVASVLFGLSPALKASRVDLVESLKETGRNVTGARDRHRFLNALVVAEVALALTLFIGAGLMINSFIRLGRADPGFDPDHLLTMETHLPTTGYEEVERKRAYFREVESRVNALPGVEAVAISHVLPVSGGHRIQFEIPGRDVAPDERLSAHIRKVNHEYFAAMRIPVLKGRALDRRLDGLNTRVVVINEVLASRYWPGEDPIGQRLVLPDSESDAYEIVGVVGNIRQRGLNRDPRAEIFVPFEQFPSDAIAFAIRSTSDPEVLTATVRQLVQEVDPKVPVYNIRPMRNLLDSSLEIERISAVLLIVLAALALALSATGIFGIMAYTVSQRTHEIGVRMAMGAQQLDVCRMVVRGGVKLIAIGGALGLGAAFALTRALTSMLHGISPSDPITYVAVSIAFAGIALLACWLPARRAARVEPMVALRTE
jgi:predicted permease